MLGDNTITDPRKDPRRESLTHSISASENVTPRSVAMDTDITSPTRHQSSEPTPTAAHDNTVAIPTGPRSAGLALRNANHGPSPLELLTRCLSNFGQTITKETVLAQQQDVVAKRFERKKLEHERWHSHHESFTSLADEQVKDMNKTKEILAEATENRQKHEESRERSLQSLAWTLLSLSTGSGLPKEESESDIAFVKTELKRLKSQLRDMQFTVRAQNSINQSVKDLAAEQDHLSTQFKLLETKVASIKTYPDLESKVTRLSERIDQLPGLNAQVRKLEEQINPLNRLTIESDHEKLSALYEEFQTIKTVMHGAGKDDPPLLDIIQRHDDDILKLKSAFTLLDNDLSSLHDAKQDLETQITSISQAHNETSPGGDSLLDVKTAQQNLLGRLLEMSDELESVREEQAIKDVNVDAEIDQLKANIQTLQGTADIDGKDEAEMKTQIEAIHGAVEKKHLEMNTQIEANSSRIQNLSSWVSNMRASMNEAHPSRTQMSPSPQASMQSFANVPTENSKTTGIMQGLPSGSHNKPSPINVQGLNHAHHQYPSPKVVPTHGFTGQQFVASPTHSSANGPTQLPSSVQQMQPPQPTVLRRQSGTPESPWPVPAPINCNIALGEHLHRILRCEALIGECQNALRKAYSNEYIHHLVGKVQQTFPYLNNLASMQTDVEALKHSLTTVKIDFLQLKRSGDAPNNVIDLTSGVSEEHFEKTVNGLKEDLEKSFRELREIVTAPLDAVTKSDWTGLTTMFQKVKTEIEEKSQSLRSDINEANGRLKFMHGENVEIFGEIHESIQNLENHIGISRFKANSVNGEIVSPRDGFKGASMMDLPEVPPIHRSTGQTAIEAKPENPFQRKRNGSDDLQREGSKKSREG